MWNQIIRLHKFFFILWIIKTSDHLFNLYGPTLAHQEGKGGILLKPVKSSEYEEDIGDDESDLSRENTPPPLPPRAERNNSFLGSFRKSSSVRRKNSANNAGMQLQ